MSPAVKEVAATRKKLIEVALPLEAISSASRRDKDRKVGTIKNAHKWFAPMPTPAWRALLFATLVDDPGDPGKREELLGLIKRLCPEDGGPPPSEALAEARQILRSVPSLPVVFDPFCGGGSTIIEAQRLGLQAVASELNPVAVLITRTLAELIPRIAGTEPIAAKHTLKGIRGGPLEGFLADVRHYAERVHDLALRKVGHLYPPGPRGGTVIAWLWARTVVCANPACRSTIPLYSSPVLNRGAGEERWLKPVTDDGRVRFEIGKGTPASEATKVSRGGAAFRCLVCLEVSPDDHIRSEAGAGRMGTQLLAVVVDRAGNREYVPPTPEQGKAATLKRPDDSLEIALPPRALGFRVQLYGMKTQADLYTARQLHALTAFSEATAEVAPWVRSDSGSEAYSEAIASVLGLCLGKLAQANSTQVRWNARQSGFSKAEPAFSRHALPMVWDFAEVNPFGGSVGDWLGLLESVEGAIRSLPADTHPARVEIADARVAADKLSVAGALIATDPPYFAQIGYADLSDYFYVWHRRALRNVHPDLYGTITTPKEAELIASPYRHETSQAARDFFMNGFRETFRSLSRAARSDLPMLVIYAHRQEETDGDQELTSTAWDAMLQALLDAGLGIQGTWPIHATTSARQIGQGTNALASYIVLVCWPRLADTVTTDRQGFLRALRSELPAALKALQSASIPTLDLTQAAIGPGMGIFSRFSRVIEPDGKPMGVRTALSLINQVRSEILTEQDDEFDRETKWAVQWFEEYGFDKGPFGRAEVLFTATATSLEGLKRAGIVGSSGGKVWLLSRDDLHPGWDPAADGHNPVWEVTQYLIKRLSERGEQAAAELLAQVTSLGDSAKDLAYRLSDVCERKRWAAEALACNSLVVSWPEIARQASATQQRPAEMQGTLL